MSEACLALKVSDIDNVATVFANGVVEGTVIRIMDKKGECDMITVRESVPYGHKIALCEIEAGENINKYGEVIGAASRKIAKGEYVHVHNMEALRGRGDK